MYKNIELAFASISFLEASDLRKELSKKISLNFCVVLYCQKTEEEIAQLIEDKIY